MAQRSSLLILFHGDVVGGAEKYGITIAREASQRGLSVTCVLRSELRPVADVLRGRQIQVHFLDLSGGVNGRRAKVAWRVFLQTIRTLHLLWRQRPSCVIQNIPWPGSGVGSTLSCGLTGTPTIAVHHLVPAEFTLPRPIAVLHRWARRRSVTIVAVSKNNRELLAHSLGEVPTNMHVIYPGVDPTPLSDAEREDARNAIRSELGLHAARRVVLSVGRLDTQKGHHHLLQAFSLVHERCPEAFLAIAGDGPCRDHLITQAASLGVQKDVRFLGHRDDVPHLHAAAEVFAFPSLFEGLGIALLEAMAAGLPIVASNRGPMAEILKDQVTALLCDPEDHEQLASLILALVTNPARATELGSAARLAARTFPRERMIAETFDLLPRVESSHIN